MTTNKDSDQTDPETSQQTDDDRPTWEQQAGLSPDTTSVRIYPSRSQKQEWEQEAADSDASSLSQYLITRIQEARADHLVGLTPADDTGPDAAASATADLQDRVDKLEAENQRLEAELRDERRRSTNRNHLDNPAVVKQFLSTTPKPLDALLQEIVETGELDTLVRKPVENTLYYLAQQGEATYDRSQSPGWRRTTDTEEER